MYPLSRKRLISDACVYSSVVAHTSRLGAFCAKNNRPRRNQGEVTQGGEGGSWTQGELQAAEGLDFKWCRALAFDEKVLPCAGVAISLATEER